MAKDQEILDEIEDIGNDIRTIRIYVTIAFWVWAIFTAIAFAAGFIEGFVGAL